MLKFLKYLLGLFSPYVSSFERRTDRFFRGVKSTDSLSSVRKKLLELMQENLVVVSVWLEKKFKGYDYLNKKARRQMYANEQAIVAKLEEHIATHSFKAKDIETVLNVAKLPYPYGDEDKIMYIFQIMSFLRPGTYYHYIDTASFGKLLRDPNIEKMEGDCNQIVTLYIYLFSLKFSIDDLRIKLLPEHVCLHFRDIDIECTNGTFQKYKECKDVLPVTEIVSTNLLDLSDFREDVQVINERDMVKSAQLAYALSSLRSLVAKNLDIAYRNLGIYALHNHNFETAFFYLNKINDVDLLLKAQNNAAVYYLEHNDFKKAMFYADKSGDNDLKKAIWGKEYNLLVQNVQYVKTVVDAKKHKWDYEKMLALARKMGDKELEKGISETLRRI